MTVNNDLYLSKAIYGSNHSAQNVGQMEGDGFSYMISCLGHGISAIIDFISSLFSNIFSSNVKPSSNEEVDPQGLAGRVEASSPKASELRMTTKELDYLHSLSKKGLKLIDPKKPNQLKVEIVENVKIVNKFKEFISKLPYAISEKFVQFYFKLSLASLPGPLHTKGFFAALPHQEGIRELVKAAKEGDDNQLYKIYNRLPEATKDSFQIYTTRQGEAGLLKAETVKNYFELLLVDLSEKDMAKIHKEFFTKAPDQEDIRSLVDTATKGNISEARKIFNRLPEETQNSFLKFHISEGGGIMDADRFTTYFKALLDK